MSGPTADGRDPLDLEAFRADAHRLVDWMADYLGGVGERPVWSPLAPGEVRAALPATAPELAEPFDALLADLDDVVLPGITHWQHPGFFAFFPSNASPPSVLAEMAIAALSVQGMQWQTSPAATELESHVLDWLVDAFGLPSTWRVDSGVGGGVIQGSASDATHTALVTARHVATRRGAATDDLVAYTSSQAHSSVEKGARVAGFRHVRLVDVDEHLAQRPDALRTAIEADVAAGLVPAFVCSAVGTTGTGALDDVRAIGEVARAHGCWHHVDAAWAGTYAICPEHRGINDGVELADSYVTNPHKLMYAGVDCTVYWVADRAPLVDAMSIVPPYLRNAASDAGEVVDYRDWHVALGRRFRALKLWFVLRMFGLDGIRSRFREHVGWAAGFADHVRAHPHLELFAPAPLGLVCLVHADGPDATRAMVAEIEAAPDLAVTASVVELANDPGGGGVPYLRLAFGQTWTEGRHVERLREVVDAAALAVSGT